MSASAMKFVAAIVAVLLGAPAKAAEPHVTSAAPGPSEFEAGKLRLIRERRQR